MRAKASALLLLLLLTTGCWDARPLDQRAFVTMLGIDKSAENRFRVTLQLQRAILGERRRQGGEQQVGYEVMVAEGESVRKAVSKVRDDLARDLDTTFLDVVVIGREAAAHLEDLDWIVRSFRIPVSSFVAVAPDQAEPVVRAGSPGFGIPSQFALFALLPTSWSRSPAVVPGYMWMIFNRNWFTPLEDAFAPVLTEEGGKLRFHGAALFRGSQLAGYLSEEDAANLSLLLGAKKEVSVTAQIPGHEGATATLYLESARIRRRVAWQQSRAVIRVELQGQGTLRELTRLRMTTPDLETKVEAALAQGLADSVRSTLERMRELNSDPVGFGELARQAAPYRQEVQSGEAWHAAYQEAKVEVVAGVTMATTGYMK